MLGIIAFWSKYNSCYNVFFPQLLLASFAIAMIGIIIAVTSAYDKDTTRS